MVVAMLKERLEARKSTKMSCKIIMKCQIFVYSRLSLRMVVQTLLIPYSYFVVVVPSHVRC